MAMTFEGVYLRDHRVPDALSRLREALPAVSATELADAGQPTPISMRRASLAFHEGASGTTEIVGFPPGAGESFARELSRAGRIAVAAGVEEGEVWFYGMYRDGELVDRYVSLSEYLDDEAAVGAPTGEPEKVAAAWSADARRLTEVVREPAAHAEAALADFLEALGIAGALEPVPPESVRIELLVPEVEMPGDEEESSPEEEEEAVRSMLGALGLDEGRAAQYMDVLKSLEKVAVDKGLADADSADAERMLMESPELRGMAGKVAAMRRELMAAFEKTVEAAGTKDPALRGVLSRADRAARLETELADNMRRFKAQPREAMKGNAELLRALLAGALSVELGRDADAARELDVLLARFRDAEPALSRDLSRALPLLATHFVADALLSGSGLDLVRQPTTGAIKLRRGSVDADPAVWVTAALARRATVPLRQSIDAFLEG